MNGFNFWTVIKVKKADQEIPAPTLILHEWNGATPSLTIRANISIGTANSLPRKFRLLSRQAVIRTTEPKVWTRKYFKAASPRNLVALLMLVKNMIGIKDNLLSSRATQEINTLPEETIIMILKIRVEINKRTEGLTKGSKKIGKKVKPIGGAWAHKLKLAYLSNNTCWCTMHLRFWFLQVWCNSIARKA